MQVGVCTHTNTEECPPHTGIRDFLAYTVYSALIQAIIGASEASPLMTPKPYFRPDICRYIYIYICLVRTSYRKSPFARPKMAAHPLHPGSCTLYRGGGLPPGLHFATAPHRGRWLLGTSEKNGPATLEQPPMVVSKTTLD